MIANNIFKATGDFFTNIAFKPLDFIRFMDNWWLQSIISWVFVIITMVAFIYWMGQLNKFKNEGAK